MNTKTLTFAYATAAALIADFKAGAKFVCRGPGKDSPVTTIEATQDPLRFVVQPGNWAAFDLTGSHRALGYMSLVKIAEAPTPAATPATSTEPFHLQAFLSGRAAINPKTGETVESIALTPKGVLVTLKHPTTGELRVSERYLADGKHRFHEPRSLRLVPVKPKTRPMRLEVVKLDSGGWTARCLGLEDKPRHGPRQVGERVEAGIVRGVTVFVQDFEVPA